MSSSDSSSTDEETKQRIAAQPDSTDSDTGSDYTPGCKSKKARKSTGSKRKVLTKKRSSPPKREIGSLQEKVGALKKAGAKRKIESDSDSDSEPETQSKRPKKETGNTKGRTSASKTEKKNRNEPKKKESKKSPAAESNEMNKKIKKQKNKKKVETIEDLQQARLSRHKLALLMKSPSFESTITGGYVRLAEATGSGTKCKIWSIIGVEDADKPYNLEGKMANQNIKCQSGDVQKVFCMQYASNCQFEKAEFEEWLKISQETGKVPLVRHLKKKMEKIQKELHSQSSEKRPKLSPTIMGMTEEKENGERTRLHTSRY